MQYTGTPCPHTAAGFYRCFVLDGHRHEPADHRDSCDSVLWKNINDKSAARDSFLNPRLRLKFVFLLSHRLLQKFLTDGLKILADLDVLRTYRLTFSALDTLVRTFSSMAADQPVLLVLCHSFVSIKGQAVQGREGA